MAEIKSEDLNIKTKTLEPNHLRSGLESYSPTVGFPFSLHGVFMVKTVDKAPEMTNLRAALFSWPMLSVFSVFKHPRPSFLVVHTE